MNKEKQKKILEFIKSNKFTNGFLIFSSLIGALISVGNFNFVNELNAINVLSFPIAFAVGVNGLIFIPMVCENKLEKLNNSQRETNLVENQVTEELVKEEIIKKTYSNKELIHTIDNIMLANTAISVKVDLLAEWQEYLENTFIDENGIKIIQELIYYLMLINTLPLEKIIPLLKEREDILDLLIHFSNNGEELVSMLNKEIKDKKKERTI